MKKSELQAIYREIKRNRMSRSRKAPATNQKGCQSCGKVTWKPGKNSTN